MVRGSDEGRPLRGESAASGMVRTGRMPTRQLADAFLAAKEAIGCAPNTVRKYRWALGCLERAYPMLPTGAQDIIRFVSDEPFQSGNSRRALYDIIRNFYAWVGVTKGIPVAQLPPVNFGRRRAGEKRGRWGKI